MTTDPNTKELTVEERQRMMIDCIVWALQGHAPKDMNVPDFAKNNFYVNIAVGVAEDRRAMKRALKLALLLIDHDKSSQDTARNEVVAMIREALDGKKQ